MNPLQRALIEKAGHDNGFEYVLASDGPQVVLASARHPARVLVNVAGHGFVLSIDHAAPTLSQELQRSFVGSEAGGQVFELPSEAQLALCLRRVAALSQSLPNQAVVTFEQQVRAELALVERGAIGTEVQRLVRQRVGQQAYRAALMDYWGGACAVTGLALPQVLRASHAKPWALCETDAERLDVFNGVLLAANLDALFDQFLLSFDEHGGMLLSPQLEEEAVKVLGLSSSMRMRWIAPSHQPYLHYHRAQFYAAQDR